MGLWDKLKRIFFLRRFVGGVNGPVRFIQLVYEDPVDLV